MSVFQNPAPPSRSQSDTPSRDSRRLFSITNYRVPVCSSLFCNWLRNCQRRRLPRSTVLAEAVGKSCRDDGRLASNFHCLVDEH